MITPFDVSLFLAVLLAMLMSRQPKRAAVSLCAIALLAMIAADYLLSGIWFYKAAVYIELWLAIVFVAIGRIANTDRLFMRLMAIMFVISCAVTSAYTYTDGITHAAYLEASRGVAMLHVAIMLGLSDGTGSLIDHWRSGARHRHYLR